MTQNHKCSTQVGKVVYTAITSYFRDIVEWLLWRLWERGSTCNSKLAKHGHGPLGPWQPLGPSALHRLHHRYATGVCVCVCLLFVARLLECVVMYLRESVCCYAKAAWFVHCHALTERASNFMQQLQEYLLLFLYWMSSGTFYNNPSFFQVSG